MLDEGLVEIGFVMPLTVTDKFVFAERLATKILLIRIVLVEESALHIGVVPILVTKVVLTLEAQVPLVIENSEGKTIRIEAPLARGFLKRTVKLYEVTLETVLFATTTLAEVNLLGLTIKDIELLAKEYPLLDI